MTLDPQRRSALLARQLEVLVRDHAGEASVVLGTFAYGAALRRGDDAWVMVSERPRRGLGPALAWARQQSGRGTVNVVVAGQEVAGVLARRAHYFTQPVAVWRADGRSLVRAPSAPLVNGPTPDARALALVPDIVAAGVEPVIEFGVVTGEVVGLEVCRVTVDATSGEAWLEVGLGAHDREAFALMHGSRPTVAALRGVASTIASHRGHGARPHALNRLARERALRWWIVRTPSSIGAAALSVAAPPVPRENVKDSVPCVAAGVAVDGRPIVVVCSTGVDLDVVPFAADARVAAGGGELVIAVPAADRHAVTLALAAGLREPARVVAVEPR